MKNKYLLKKEIIDDSEICIIENEVGQIIAKNNISSKEKFDIDLCTTEFIEWIINNYPKIGVCIPKIMMTKEQRQKCYENMSIEDRKKFISDGYMKGLITSDIFNELLDSSDFGNLNCDITVIKKIDKKAYNQENSVKLLNKNNGKYIKFIPEKYLTFDMCKKAVELDRHNIAGVPMKYQSIELQKLAIDKFCTVISYIPKKALSDEIIRYALNLNGLALRDLPKEKLTAEYCEIAFEKNPRIFKYIPDKYKNYDMCIKALLTDTSMIKNIPAHIINKQFLKDINSLYIIIPEKSIGYVKQCISTNTRTNEIMNKNIDSENSKETQSAPVNKELEKIDMDSLRPYFSGQTFNLLKSNNIENLEQLCNMVNQPEMIIDIKNNKMRNEVVGTTLLLRCKYLNEDPLIDINDKETKIKEILWMLGMSNRATNCLRRTRLWDKSINEFFYIVRTTKFLEILRDTRCVGKKTFNEIVLKLRIITSYYDKVGKKPDKLIQNDNDSDDSNDNESDVSFEELKSLYDELQRLREEKTKIDKQTDIVLAKIQEKMMAQSKGGVQKCKKKNN